jgi:hypothetical protein
MRFLQCCAFNILRRHHADRAEPNGGARCVAVDVKAGMRHQSLPFERLALIEAAGKVETAQRPPAMPPVFLIQERRRAA